MIKRLQKRKTLLTQELNNLLESPEESLWSQGYLEGKLSEINRFLEELQRTATGEE